MSELSALVLGATGGTGQHVLKEVLASKDFTRVGEYGRRVTQDIVEGQAKLEQKVIDFEKLGESGLKEGRWDVVFITMGTTRAQAGSAAAFEKIDREYVINAARAAKSDDPSHDQRVVYLSSGGASVNSPFLYLKSKGLTEKGLAELGYKDTIIFKPGYLTNATRRESRPLEPFLNVFMGAVSCFVSAQIDVSLLASAMVKSGRLGSSGLPASALPASETTGNAQFTVIGNKGSVALGEANV
ncbi:hypothetical protein SCHPADRAFT_993847 [Schizopora paradoxa]|uniref:NAD(P)-binding domain-containing protein n=1 Tax=Schizopora paradoxa TaxID=27342 RepID=A0A0H2S220_9AGAM|nr:hypothetical protein SCHPADRAFT_993847 [Schizopora paradoxa]